MISEKDTLYSTVSYVCLNLHEIKIQLPT